MSNNAKFWGLAVVALGLIGWSTVESYRVAVTSQQAAEAQALQERVMAKLEVVRAKYADVARNGSSPSARQRTATTVATEIQTPQQ